MLMSTVLVFLIAIPISAGFALLHIAGPDALAPISALAVDAVIFVAIMRYRLFVVTPEAVAAEILATIPEPVILLDDQRRVIEMNPSALMLTGYTRADARGLRFEALIGARDAHPPARWRTEVAALGAPERPAALLTREGKRVPIAVSHTTVWDEFHQPAGSVILARDLRRSEEMQARLIQSEKLASIGQVAAGVAHEVNNPTTYILTNVRRLNALAQALEDAAAGRARADLTPSSITDIAAQVRDISADCEEGATRIKNIVASLGAFSRMPASRREPVQLNDVIESAVKVLDARIRAAADVKRDYGDLPAVMGDTGSLGQVALNLLMNALQAVEARGRRGRIEIRTGESRGWVVIELRDDGIGIGAEVLPSIFDPFFTTKKTGEGTGLGLAICLDIIRRHGGDISVESAPGEGSAFFVKLPQATEGTEQPAAEALSGTS
jgi:PAS domain S-box-containing protein